VATAVPSAAAEPDFASAALDPQANELIEEARAHESSHLTVRDRWSAVVLGFAFLGVAVALPFVVHSDRSPSFLTTAALVVAYAIASNASFEVGMGLVLPTELFLVPMLFILPLGTVPLAVAAGLLLGAMLGHLRKGPPLDRILLVPLNSWYSVGPVVVLALAASREPALRYWPVYIAALAAQFAFDYLAQAPRQRYVNGVPLRMAARLMSSAFVVDAALALIGLLVAMVAVHNASAILFALPLMGLLGYFARERQVRIDHAIELGQAYRGTAFLLGDVVEADDAYTGSHSRDVVSLVMAVSDRLGLNARERRDAEFVALLHDVGKIKVPSEIINKPGALTPEERAIINMHTIEGERLLAQVGGILGNVGRIVRSCHEDWDGTGYPDGLAAEEIPLVARIVRCCDAFSAMTTDRPYRAARSIGEALDELRGCSGTDFDPRVVDALTAAVAGENP
jgi:HD-GYP domain-containing protein (c-di-GMP phosphodiesterase class II)